MGFIYRRRIPINRHTWINVSKSGASLSRRVGRVTANTRGRVTARITRHLSYRTGR